MCVCVCMCVSDCSFYCYRWNCWPSLLSRSVHNGTWNSPNMRHSFIFLPKEECNWLKTRNNKKSLKILKEQSETVYRRRTDNTMAKRKSTKGQTTIDKTYVYKAKDRVTRTPLKTGGELRCSGRVSCSCYTSGTRRVNLVTNPVIGREWGKDREVVICDTDIP
jgi:hypothetical protein